MNNETAIFFDLDGTLVDTRADLAAAVNHTRGDFNLPPLALDDVLACVGQGAKYLLSHTIPECAASFATDDVAFEKVWGHFRERYRAHMLDEAKLYPTVRETLEELKSRGYLLGVNTAKPAFATRTLLDHLGILEFFGEAVVAGGDSPEMKPSALPLLMCAEKMNHAVTPRDWMVGDHWTDLQCAARAGVQSAFCAFGFGTPGDEPVAVRLERMNELLQFLER